MNGTPKISAVICTYNRDRYIEKALHTLLTQTLAPAYYEVIVVDNNSTDSTARRCQAFMAAHPGFPMRYVLEPSKGLSFARNRGVREARSGLVAFMDDDAEASPVFLETLLKFFTDHPEAVGAGGKIIPMYPDTGEPVWMNRYLNGFVGHTDFGEQVLKYTPKMKYPAGCNMTYRKEVLERAGGFNNDLTFRSDDKYIFYKVAAVSDAVYYVPRAEVRHNIDGDRVQFESFKKLFLKTGNEEKVRIRTEGGSLLKKFAELLFKFCASLLLYASFVAKGQELKGRYVVWAQWFTLKGFLQKTVFVR